MDKPVSTNVARIRNIFDELKDLNMFTSEVDRVAALVDSTKHVSSMGSIVTEYIKTHPTLGSQTFSSLSAYIIEQLPLATAQVRANSAAQQAIANEATIAQLQAELATATASLALFAASATGAPKTTQRSNKKPSPPPPTAAAKAKWTPGRPYCWQHGFVQHNGSECTRLEEEPKWKRDAVNPGPIHGQYGSRRFE